MELIESVRQLMQTTSVYAAANVVDRLNWLAKDRQFERPMDKRDLHRVQDEVREWADRMEMAWRSSAW